MMRRTPLTVLALAALCLLSKNVGADESVNQRVVKFCESKLGEKVGSGQCAALASAALNATGAKPHYSFKDTPNTGDYVWGTLVYVLEMTDGKKEERRVVETGVQPGDVIQFRDAKFSGKKDGKIYTGFAPQHTAVVKSVKAKGKELVVLEQNVSGKMIVVEGSYNLNDLKAGWLRVYRPVPK